MALPTDPALQQIAQLDRNSPNFQDQLDNALHGQGYLQCVPNINNNDSTWLVNYLDEVLGGLDPTGPASRKCLRELGTICGTRAILPASYILPPERLTVTPDPFDWGGFGNVHMGTLDDLAVCVKRAQVFAQDDPQAAARIFCKEAVMWKYLQHANILPLRGVTMDPLQLVSNWMPDGNLSNYIRDNPNADRLGLLSNVAEGLKYLHACNVVHGDLKGPNVLVDDSVRARIADFGISIVTRNLNSIRPPTTQNSCTPRYAAPEVLDGENPSKKSDIFSFAMVMIEVFTSAVPFRDKAPLAAAGAIIRGERPPRPAHPAFTDNLWALTQQCWDEDPNLRPDIQGVLQTLP
ncbi:kinase-like protein [Thelephora ganbajun]|uniref:Kinase-like protein n=1 Tax=Thelephora ganbajun TaxID=370292 RepID=A0ACB6Z6X4_THEGA|nr:kinase-like protein [Thelephora ganbajun]